MYCTQSCRLKFFLAARFGEKQKNISKVEPKFQQQASVTSHCSEYSLRQSFEKYSKHHRDSHGRRRVFPTAIGRTPLCSFLSANRFAIESTGAVSEGTRISRMTLIRDVMAVKACFQLHSQPAKCSLLDVGAAVLMGHRLTRVQSC